jgi:hypothetical protein
MSDPGRDGVFSGALRSLEGMECCDMTTARICSVAESGPFRGWLCASEREDALRVGARLGATGLRAALVMLVQELSRRLVGAVLDGAERSW